MGVKLEVNERIFNFCIDLMKVIWFLVMMFISLQKEIVESGRGVVIQQEFYVKNLCWIEGFILVFKVVGWGVMQLVEVVDKVVFYMGKYEEFIVCFYEIVVSMVQLVVVFKVKVDKYSFYLSCLQECFCIVNERVVNVVVFIKLGQEQIEDRDIMDFFGLFFIKLKKQEMEIQVCVLELEKMLEVECMWLGELWKQYYVLVGVLGSFGEEVVSQFSVVF